MFFFPILLTFVPRVITVSSRHSIPRVLICACIVTARSAAISSTDMQRKLNCKTHAATWQRRPRRHQKPLWSKERKKKIIQRNHRTVGTKRPLDMSSWSSAPLGLPLATSSRSRSPLLRWTKPYFLMMRSHWVPLPQPGPPIIQTVFMALAAVYDWCCLGEDRRKKKNRKRWRALYCTIEGRLRGVGSRHEEAEEEEVIIIDGEPPEVFFRGLFEISAGEEGSSASIREWVYIYMMHRGAPWTSLPPVVRIREGALCCVYVFCFFFCCGLYAECAERLFWWENCGESLVIFTANSRSFVRVSAHYSGDHREFGSFFFALHCEDFMITFDTMECFKSDCSEGARFFPNSGIPKPI